MPEKKEEQLPKIISDLSSATNVVLSQTNLISKNVLVKFFQISLVLDFW
jgi:hypothetical protein